MRKVNIIHYFLCMLCFCQLASAETVRLPGSPNIEHHQLPLPYLLLSEVLRRGGKYEAYHPDKDIWDQITFARQIENVLSGDYQVFWTPTSIEYEEQFIPVRIPIYRGFLGLRLCIVREEDRNIFEHVTTLEQLKRFTAGQGHQWADTGILEHNQLDVVKVRKYRSHFPMLDGERFDYFPRGASEPWSEVAAHSEYDLTVEPNILLRYRAPFYFFVNKNYPEIANHLTLVLEEMISDGSFNKMFLADDQVRQGLMYSNFSHRTVIELENPYLHQKTPLERSELWFDPFNEGAQSSIPRQ